jgi:hypothetical protein
MNVNPIFIRYKETRFPLLGRVERGLKKEENVNIRTFNENIEIKKNITLVLLKKNQCTKVGLVNPLLNR